MSASSIEKVTVDISERLTELLRVKEISRKELANRLGISPATVSYYCKGSRTPNLTRIIRISEAVDTPLSYFLSNSLNVDLNRLPLLDTTSLKLSNNKDSLKHKVMNITSESKSEYLPDYLKAKHDDKMFALKVSCDSMTPTIQLGDAVIARELEPTKCSDKEFSEAPHIILIKNNPEAQPAMMIRRIFSFEKRLLLIPDNTRYRPFSINLNSDDCIIKSEVVGLIRGFV